MGLMTVERIIQAITPILKKHGIRRAGLFGSYAKNSTTQNSDVDILVELGSDFSLLDFIRVKLDLEDILKTKVDLVEYQAIKPRLKNKILSEEMRIYG